MYRLDSLAPLVPQHVLEAVRLPKRRDFELPRCLPALKRYSTSFSFQAQEQFILQYAGVFGDHVQQQQTWQDAYSRRLVTVSDIELTDTCLGEGFSGKVYLAHLRGARQQEHSTTDGDSFPGLHVALKVITRAISGQSHGHDDVDAVIRCALLEARLHARMEHPNLVRLLAVQEARQPIMLALELCKHGALLDVLRAAGINRPDFSVLQCTDMAAQAAAGLRYLHSKLCVHRDVAARNVLLSDVPPYMTHSACGYVLKLSDLGLARQLRTEADYYQVLHAQLVFYCQS
jgi:hypothetical protein